MDSFWVILVGILVASSSGLLGSLLVLRNATMIGDAISHAVLPGIVIGALFTGMPNTFYMLLGAVFFGLLATMLIAFLHQVLKLQSDASIGVVYTTLFSFGVILVSYFAKNAHLDQDCVLYGEIAYVAFEETLSVFGLEIPNRVIWLIAVFIVILFVMLWGYKGWVVTTFDSVYSESIGVKNRLWHLILMLLVSLNTAASFESVGSILVVSFLVLPPASARLLCRNLKHMWSITLLFALVASLVGYYLASLINASISATMAVVAAINFFLVFVLKPSRTLG